MHDEVHYQEGQGPAKRFAASASGNPAELATLIAAAFPIRRINEAAGFATPSAEPLVWPWSEERFRARLAEAQAVLAERTAEAGSQAS